MLNHWPTPEKWNALLRGEGCPLCVAVKPGGVDKGFSHFIADLSMGRLFLHNNQYVKGYCGLICFKHVREPYELPQDEQEQYWADIMLAGMALEKAFGADKMNFQILGNLVPHLHTHIQPRYLGDEGGGGAMDTHGKTVLLKPEEYQERVELIRQTISLIQNHR
jgi:diadenosine tetraphosphate (Ap4A) HIT family hydrolase